MENKENDLEEIVEETITSEAVEIIDVEEEDNPSKERVAELVQDIEKSLTSKDGKISVVQETSDVDVQKVLDLMSNMSKETEALNSDKVVDYLNYLLCGSARPAWAEQLLADGDNRLKEYEMIMILRSMGTLPKVELSASIVLDSVIKDLPNLKFMTVVEKINVLERLSKYKNDVLATSHNYNKLSKDIQSLPLIYRQLLDELFKVPTNKINRLKLLPEIIDLPDENWNRIVEITKMK